MATTCDDPQLQQASPPAGAMPAPSLSRRILSGSAWSIAGRIGSMGSLFVLNALLARTLDKPEYAAFLAASSLVPFLAMLATLGVPYTLVRALRADLRDSSRRFHVFWGALKLTLVGGVVTAVCLVASRGLFPAAEKWSLLRDWTWLVAAWAAQSAMCVVCANFLQGVDDFKMAALIGARSGGLAPNLLTLAIVAAAAAAGALTLPLLMTSQVASFAVTMVLAAAVIALACRPMDAAPAPGGQRRSPPASPDFSARWYFRESWPNLINQLIGVALVEMDLFWVACLAPENVVAEYGVVRNLRLLVTAPLLIGSVSLAPFVAELHSQGDMARLERMLRGTATLFALPSLAALAVLLAAPQAVIAVTFGPAFTHAATALAIISLGCIIFVITGNNGLALTMTGRHRDLMVCSLISLGLYLAISPPLVARYGVDGAAVAFAAQTVAANVLATLRVKQKLGVWTVPYGSRAALRSEWDQLRRRLNSDRRRA
ncbi:MAG: lipopolysaccharide biosynthesis protein [Pirellulales bacterium]|nr:lipopolysaccharide biosynthesis protein [Pirellulales bacterium]